MSAEIDLIKWAVDHGVQGVLSLVVAAEGWVIYRLWKDNRELNEQRIGDMMKFIDISNRFHDKIEKTASDLARAVDFMERRLR